MNTPTSELQTGGLYTINNGEGQFGVAKVLVLEPSAVHIRLYKNKYAVRSQSVDPAALSLGSVNDKSGGFGIGHLPLSRRNFMSWQPVFLLQQPVSKEELEGYKMWKEAGGDVFGQQ